MRTFLRIIFTLIVVVLLLLIILPFAFHGKMDRYIKEEGNKMLNAKFDYGRLNISLFRHFPKASISLYDFWIAGEGEFAKDTLCTMQEASIVVDISSIFNRKSFDISKVEFIDINLHAIVTPEGKNNWDILKDDDKKEEAEKQEEKKKEHAFKLELKRMLIKRLNLIYDDRMIKQHLAIGNFNMLCSGDFTKDASVVNLQTKIDSVNYTSNNVTLLSNASIFTDMYVNADFKTKKFTLKKNEIEINAIKTSMNGWFALEDKGVDMDLVFNTNEVKFKDLLSLIPTLYNNNFESLKTDGTAQVDAWVKGLMSGDSIVPAFHINLDIKDGMFKYPSLPASVDNIDLNAKIDNPGGSLNNTTINIEPLAFQIAGNPFNFNAIIKTPVSDPEFNLLAKGTIDLNTISQVVPLADLKYNGIITTDVDISGKASYIENEQFDQIKATGHINISNMQMKLNNGMDLDVEKSLFTFTPKYLQLSETAVKIGDSDFSIKSRLDNYLGYAFKNGALKGTVTLQSNFINLDDFTYSPAHTDPSILSDFDDKDKLKTPDDSIGLLIVPSNVDFAVTADLKEVVLNKMILTNINGRFNINNAIATMQNLSMNAMGGTLVMNGSYSSAEMYKPKLNAGFRITDISFNEAYKELDFVKQLAPVFGNINGDFSGSINIETELDDNMNAVLPTFQGNGNINTKDVNLSGVKAIDDIADAINKPELKYLSAKNISLDFTIKDGRLETQPFEMKMGNFSLNLSGSTGLDQSIDYKGIIKLPGKLGNTGIHFNIGGTFSSPNVNIDTKSTVNQATRSLTKKLGEKLGIDSTSTTKPDTDKKSSTGSALDFLKRL